MTPQEHADAELEKLRDYEKLMEQDTANVVNDSREKSSMPVDYVRVKLGKKPARNDPRTLKLGRYFTPELAPPPPTVNHSRGISDWGMMLNDNLGCCTIAAVGHAYQVQVLSQIDPNKPVGVIKPSDDIILRYYEQWDGYDPSDPSTDQGGEETDVLNKWRKNGFAGRQLLGYADPAPTNHAHVKQAIYLFGGVYIGIQLPTGWQNAGIWDANMGDPGSWGGHAVYVCDYDDQGVTCITWGMLQKITWDGWDEYCDENHALVTPEWNPPVGFAIDSLLADLAAVTG